MAIEWGAWEGSSPNRIRVGIDVDWSGPVNHGWETVKATVKYYVDVEGNWSDSQTLTLSGAIDGTVNFSNNQNNSQALRETRERTYTYGNCEYGSSPGSWTFTVKLSGAFNGATPSKSVTKSIPSRPYGGPAAPTNVNSSYINDSSIKTTWTNKETCGEPWDRVRVQYDVGANDVWNGDVGTAGGGATSFTHSGAEPNRSYRYRIRSENNVSDSGWVEGDLIYTTPATPTNLVRAGNNGANQVLTWENNVYSLLDHRIEIQRATNGVWEQIVEFHPRDSTTYTDTWPATHPNDKFKYRVRSRTWGGAQGVLYSPWSNETTETTGLSLPPNAPTSLNPAGSVLINPTQARVFSWAYNSADGAAQTAYQIQWRVAAGAWNVMAKVVSGTQSPTIAANTFPDNSTIEWQVRTWGVAGSGGSDGTGASPYSALATFKTVGDPNALREQKRVMRLNLESGRPETSPVGVLPPIGSMIMYGGAVAPAGWLFCHGQSLLRADYVDLFGVIGTAFGSVDSTHFNVPDMRLRIPIGATDASFPHVMTLGANDGRLDLASRGDSHSHAHSHGHTLDTGQTGSSHTHNIPGQADVTKRSSGTASFEVPSYAGFAGHAHGGDTGTSGSGHSHNVTGSVSSEIGLSDKDTSAHSWTAVHYLIKT